MDFTFKLRGGSAEEWKKANPVLEVREPGVETDTNKFKIGNGYSTWAQLPYYLSEDAILDYINEQLDNAAPITPEEVTRIADLVRIDLEIPELPELPDLVLYYENTKA